MLLARYLGKDKGQFIVTAIDSFGSVLKDRKLRHYQLESILPFASCFLFILDNYPFAATASTILSSLRVYSHSGFIESHFL